MFFKNKDGKKTKLKDLTVNKIDLVPDGGNQHANIKIFKSKDKLKKEAKSFSDNLISQKLRNLSSDLWDYFYALQDSIVSILQDEGAEKESALKTSISQFTTTIEQTVIPWAKGIIFKKKQEEKTKQEEVSMKLDLAKIKQEDREFVFKIDFTKLESLSAEDKAKLEKIKEYAGETEEPKTVEKGKDDGKDGKEDDKKDDVLKGLDDLDPVLKSIILKAQVAADAAEERAKQAEQLAKSLQEATKTNEFIAKAKNEFGSLPGVQPETLGPVLKQLQETDPTALKSLEEVLKAANAVVQKSAAFAEFGSSGLGASGSAWAKIEKAAEDLRKVNPNLTKAQAIEKVGEINPDLLAEYENER
ncbi:MAG: hypothetical protein N2738_07290 [Thermodesulfovibrionales bacterium]|nr:hypothetical protein [Thermodesulfovibrionales bacterium]